MSRSYSPLRIFATAIRSGCQQNFFRRLHSIDIGSFLTDLESSQLISDPLKSLGPLLSAYNATLSSLLDKYAPIVNKLSRRQSPSNPWFTATCLPKKSTSSASYLQPPTTPNFFGKQSINSYIANPLHRFPPPLLALHLQTALLPFSQAKYPNSCHSP